MTCVSKYAQENSQGGYKKPFSTETFEDMQANHVHSTFNDIHGHVIDNN